MLSHRSRLRWMYISVRASQYLLEKFLRSDRCFQIRVSLGYAASKSCFKPPFGSSFANQSTWRHREQQCVKETYGHTSARILVLHLFLGSSLRLGGTCKAGRENFAITCMIVGTGGICSETNIDFAFLGSSI